MPELVPGLVSVIVPIYNVEPFLRDCLDSLRAQTYTDLQVLMVDDGSTDGCAAIAEEFAAADSRFTLIRQANAGLSAARNVAVPQAKGEYLAFVDSDDVLAAHAYELLVQALAGGADFASGGGATVFLARHLPGRAAQRGDRPHRPRTRTSRATPSCCATARSGTSCTGAASTTRTTSRFRSAGSSRTCPSPCRRTPWPTASRSSTTRSISGGSARARSARSPSPATTCPT